MADVAAAGEGRDDDQRNAGAIAEEVKWLDVAGVVVAAAFVEGDDERGFREESGIGLEVVEGLLDHAFKEIEFRGCGMAVDQSVGLNERDGGQRAIVNGGEEVGGVLDVSRTL